MKNGLGSADLWVDFNRIRFLDRSSSSLGFYFAAKKSLLSIPACAVKRTFTADFGTASMLSDVPEPAKCQLMYRLVCVNPDLKFSPKGNYEKTRFDLVPD